MDASNRASTKSDGFTVGREFAAPSSLVFKAWTEADRLARWFGPKGFTMRAQTLDLRPGGIFHYCMRAPSGQDLWGKFVYREIVSPSRLVFVSSFADASGNVVRNPWNADWPLEVLSTVTFTEHDGKTNLVLEGVPLNASAIEHKAFKDNHASMQKGWGGTLDQLAEHLANS